MTWQEHKAEDGRTYYFDPETQNSTWDKPEELFTEREIALKRTNWKEYTAEGGRKYWFNTESKESVWVFPADAEAILQGEAAADESIPKEPREVREQRGREKREEHLPSLSSIAPDNVQQQFKGGSSEEIEASYKQLMADKEVDSSWTVQKLMKECLEDPRYWAVRDALRRRELFEEFLTEIEQKEVQETLDKRLEYQQRVYDLFEQSNKIGPYSRWISVEEEFRDDPLFHTGHVDDRKLALAKYVRFLNEQEQKKTAEIKAAGKQFLKSVLQIDIVKSTWNDTLRDIKSRSAELAAERPEMRLLNKMDLLDVYSKTIEEKEAELVEQIEQKSAVAARQARIARQQFVKLLSEQVDKGHIVYTTKWKELVDYIKDDVRFQNLCGIRHSSTPLDLFWDVIEVENRRVRNLRTIAQGYLTSEGKNIDSLTLDEFGHLIAACSDYTTNLEHPRYTQQVYNALKDSDFEIDRFASDRKLRRLQDDFRYALRDMEPVIQVSDTWDAVRRVADRLPEAKGLSAVQREAAFDKYIARLRDRPRGRVGRDRDVRGGGERERGDRGERGDKRGVSLDY
ncbi:hypothetical protein B0I75DRAFT_138518 [Yarrowia lipolytica]|jgi:pre-mRNA-processing factor 40|uniref:YALI0D02827p n=2 Tax=Yarrowia lipolytica TaxID=4952 RepID=Q6CAH0_YARLI|nr:YALI0D02827p [Yarrowia lipolytica CLIB122]AOW03501.1 hypothetical protein YALI1_D03604g [Yarrowia lipolytica]KAB8284720.1 hypothetical protein BKA91DRAFT_134766 [Yarrowia lipolytica]KAE8170632.1 hypothetical protein BKA90DRAFT_140492 [Yarrowia lipolytica]KAJ8054864.1 hypothetical protein LXG23DRAFT_21920 [Yarrowia lipolytica]QNP97618.1 Pre-mRNA-processing factor 40 B [Yarrowia lipolytica]|eukprot:XP_502342.1 YALI0D02827p [Yarrowia lipolytica CLIB122]